MLFTYAAICGFVVAALLATGYQLVANRPARFELVHDVGEIPIVSAIFRMVLVVWAAPYIIMRNAVRGRLIERRPLGWLMASMFIAGVWSLCAGIMVLHLAVVLG
ncbi:MAG: hypothetical protein AB8B88_08810 [Devosiaceae bacterium]